MLINIQLPTLKIAALVFLIGSQTASIVATNIDAQTVWIHPPTKNRAERNMT